MTSSDDLSDVATCAAGPAAEMLLHRPSGDNFGLSMNVSAWRYNRRRTSR